MINIFQPSLGQEELDEIKKVFESNWIGKGDWVNLFEKNFSESLGSDPQYFISTTCCTEGIFLSAELFDFGINDEVIVPSISFISVANCVVSKAATVVFCDVDKHSLNARAEHIEEKLTPRTKAVFLNHYGGFPCAMEPIIGLCRKHNITLIEDSACAVKSFYKGRACGTLGDMGLWSFDAMKVLCTGDGGMIYLKSKELMQAAREQFYYGLAGRQTSGMDASSRGSQRWWEFEINRPGRRAIMNNITAAIGLAQLRKLDNFIARRKKIYEIYEQELRPCSWLRTPPASEKECSSSYYFFWIQLEKRDELARFLLDHGIYTTFRYWPLHMVKYFKQDKMKLPNAHKISQTTLNIPLHQSLSDEDVYKIIGLIKEFGSR